MNTVGFGKHFGTMYEGSMIGAGSVRFAVMGYVIAKAMPRGEPGSQEMVVELNPELLAFILGERDAGGKQRVVDAIEFLCSPDPNSRSKDEEGRRLVRLGQFEYRVVNGMKYRTGRDPDKRREQNRVNQQRYRDKKKGKPLPGESAFVRAVKDGEHEHAERLAAEGQSVVEEKVAERALKELREEGQ